MLRVAGRRAVISVVDTVGSRCYHNAQASETRLPSSTPPWRQPTRGGQDLSKRYQRLERALRGKEAYGKEIEDLSSEVNPLHRSSEATYLPRNTTNTFMGFVVPEEPQPPGPEGACL